MGAPAQRVFCIVRLIRRRQAMRFSFFARNNRMPGTPYRLKRLPLLSFAHAAEGLCYHHASIAAINGLSCTHLPRAPSCLRGPLQTTTPFFIGRSCAKLCFENTTKSRKGSSDGSEVQLPMRTRIGSCSAALRTSRQSSALKILTKRKKAQAKLGLFSFCEYLFVTSSGFEPKSSEPESEILSIEL